VLFTVFFSVFVDSQEAFAVPSVVDPNFKVETVVSGLSLPTTMDFLGPDGVFYLVSLGLGSAIHDMRVDAFSANPLVVTQGDIVNLQATITNVGTVDEEKVWISYRDTLTSSGIGAQFKISIAIGETVVGDIIQWDTTGAILGDHVLKAKVKLNGFVDENPSDNVIFVSVTVLAPP